MNTRVTHLSSEKQSRSESTSTDTANANHLTYIRSNTSRTLAAGEKNLILEGDANIFGAGNNADVTVSTVDAAMIPFTAEMEMTPSTVAKATTYCSVKMATIY